MAGSNGGLSRRALLARAMALGGAALVGTSRAARGQGARPRPPAQHPVPMSDPDRVKAQVYEIISDQLDVAEAEIDDSKSFVEDFHADSLAMQELALAIEEKFDIKIPDDQVPRFKLVGQLVKYVKRHRR